MSAVSRPQIEDALRPHFGTSKARRLAVRDVQNFVQQAHAAGRAAAVAELQPAYGAMQARAEKAEAALARIFAAFDDGTAKVVQGLRAAGGES